MRRIWSLPPRQDMLHWLFTWYWLPWLVVGLLLFVVFLSVAFQLLGFTNLPLAAWSLIWFMAFISLVTLGVVLGQPHEGTIVRIQLTMQRSPAQPVQETRL